MGYEQVLGTRSWKNREEQVQSGLFPPLSSEKLPSEKIWSKMLDEKGEGYRRIFTLMPNNDTCFKRLKELALGVKGGEGKCLAWFYQDKAAKRMLQLETVEQCKVAAQQFDAIERLLTAAASGTDSMLSALEFELIRLVLLTDSATARYRNKERAKLLFDGLLAQATKYEDAANAALAAVKANANAAVKSAAARLARPKASETVCATLTTNEIAALKALRKLQFNLVRLLWCFNNLRVTERNRKPPAGHPLYQLMLTHASAITKLVTHAHQCTCSDGEDRQQTDAPQLRKAASCLGSMLAWVQSCGLDLRYDGDGASDAAALEWSCQRCCTSDASRTFLNDTGNVNVCEMCGKDPPVADEGELACPPEMQCCSHRLGSIADWNSPFSRLCGEGAVRVVQGVLVAAEEREARGSKRVVARLYASLQAPNPAQGQTGGCTPLFVASQNGHAAVVNVLLARQATDVNQADASGCTPLGIASQEGHIAVVTTLLAHDMTDVNQADNIHGLTPLYVAVQNSHTAVVKAILAHQTTDVNQANADGSTPLFIASQIGNVPMVTMLLTHEATGVNKARTDNGFTPLIVATQEGHLAVVEALLAGGADRSITIQGRFTALHVARQEGHHAIAALLGGVHGSPAAHGADGAADNGKSPLFFASQNGHMAIVKALLAQEATDVNQASTDNGFTPLYVASAEGHAAVVKALLRHHAIKVNQADKNGQTPLMMAACAGHRACVEALLAGGADSRIVSPGQFTAANVARQEGHHAVVVLLCNDEQHRRGAEEEAKKKAEEAAKQIAQENAKKKAEEAAKISNARPKLTDKQRAILAKMKSKK
jgi:ankyrin repeat protein